MPKRSNHFQRLILFIAGQIAPLGATVEESVMVLEQGLLQPIEREVDVLLTLNAGIGVLRIAIECRERSRKDDVSWIDELIGKYRNLFIDKVIAVSNTGFTAAAIEKARLNNITLMAVVDASTTNWQAVFHSLGYAQVSHRFTVKSFVFESQPRMTTAIQKDDTITLYPVASANALPIHGPAEDFLKFLHDRCLPRAQEYLKANRASLYKVLADVSQDVLIEHTVPLKGIVLTRADGSTHDITLMGFKFLVKTEVAKLPVKQQLLGEHAMLTTTSFVDDELAEEITITTVEIKGQNQGKGFISRSPKSD